MWTHKTFPGPFRGPAVISVCFYRCKDLVLIFFQFEREATRLTKADIYQKVLRQISLSRPSKPGHEASLACLMLRQIQLCWILDTSADGYLIPGK
jgi:hypothetical protein